MTRNYTAVLLGKQLIDLFLREVFLFSMCVHSCWLSTRSSKHPPWSWLLEWLLIIQQQGSTLWKGNWLAISWKIYFLKMLLSAFPVADRLLEIWYWLKAGGWWRYERNEARSDASCSLLRKEWGEIRLSRQEKGFILMNTRGKMFWGQHKESRKYFSSKIWMNWGGDQIGSKGNKGR